MSVQQSHLPYPERLKANREIYDSGTQAHGYKWHNNICRIYTTSRAAQSEGIMGIMLVHLDFRHASKPRDEVVL